MHDRIIEDEVLIFANPKRVKDNAIYSDKTKQTGQKRGGAATELQGVRTIEIQRRTTRQ